jgi:hypothetical protein
MTGDPVAEVVDIRSWRKARTRASDREEAALFARYCAERTWGAESLQARNEYHRVLTSDSAYRKWRGLMASRYRVVAEVLQVWDAFGLYQDL